MSLTRDEITPGITFLIGLKGLDGKRFGRAVADMKEAGGTFEPSSKQWIVAVSDDEYVRIQQSSLLRYWANEWNVQVERA